MKECMRFSNTVGDGLLSYWIIVSYILRKCEGNSGVGFSYNTLLSVQRLRICKLRSVEAVLHTMQMQQSFIVNFMISCGSWHSVTNMNHWFRNICSNIAVPAVGDMSTANDIVEVLVIVARLAIYYVTD